MHTFWALNGGQSAPAGWTTRVDLRGGLNGAASSGIAGAGACYAASLATWCIVGNKNSAVSTDEKSWSFARPFNQNQNAVAWSSSASLFVSVGEGGSIYTSSDGVNWYSQTNPLGSVIMTSIAYSSSLNLFVAVAYASSGSGQIITSANGTTWTARTASAGVGYLYSVCWSSTLSLFLYTGVGGTGSLATSPDGITWTDRTGPGAFRYYCSVYSTSLSLFIAAGATNADTACKIAYSSDGITWNDVATPGTGTRVYCLAVKGSTIYSGRGSATAYTSTDGSTWSSATTNCSYPIRAVVAATTGSFIFSTDYEINLDTRYPIWLQGGTGRVAYDDTNSTFIVPSLGGTIVYSQDNGVTWMFYNIGTNQNLLDAAVSVLNTSTYEYGIISSDTVFYADNTDIKTWGTTSLSANLKSISEGHSTSLTKNVVASTSSNKIYYSSNAQMDTFSSGTSDTISGTYINCFGKGLNNGSGVYWGLAANNALYYANAQPPTTWNLLIAADGNNKTFISNDAYAVGSNGRIQKVAGSAWTTLTSGVSTTLTAIAAKTSGVRLAVGASDVIRKSVDGTTWSASTAPSVTGVDYKGVIAGTLSFVAYGNTSLSEFVLVTSPDGL